MKAAFSLEKLGIIQEMCKQIISYTLTRLPCKYYCSTPFTFSPGLVNVCQTKRSKWIFKDTLS